VRDPVGRQSLLEAAISRFGQVDILVNNAGIAASAPAEDESLEQLQDLIDTNLTAVFGLTQLVGRHMLVRRSGVIVNIASPSAALSLDRYPLAGYGASKAGVVALTRELAYQWGGRGVRVNAIAPCFFPSATTGWLQDPDQVEWISGNAALRRPPRPEELDGPLLFLASDASSYVTGQTLYVDGGWNCR
jgi:NAD(P)-dependent dehydrogenase (short-subunit alcohol dehydrogenase family)